MMMSKIVVLVVATVIGMTHGLEYDELFSALNQTAFTTMENLVAAEADLVAKFNEVTAYLENGAKVMENITDFDDKHDYYSALYDYLDAEDPKLYGILDTYFSAANDTYEFLENSISPWYDVLDYNQVYNYSFYSLVDSFDFLYNMVDQVNHRLYDRCDDYFTKMFQFLDSLDDGEVDQEQLVLENHYRLHYESMRERMEAQQKTEFTRNEHKNIVTQKITEQNQAAPNANASTGLSTGGAAGVSIGFVACFLTIGALAYKLNKANKGSTSGSVTAFGV